MGFYSKEKGKNTGAEDGPGRHGFIKTHLAPVFTVDWSETVVDSGPLTGGYWNNSATRGLCLHDCYKESEKW